MGGRAPVGVGANADEGIPEAPPIGAEFGAATALTTGPATGVGAGPGATETPATGVGMAGETAGVGALPGAIGNVTGTAAGVGARGAGTAPCAGSAAGVYDRGDVTGVGLAAGRAAAGAVAPDAIGVARDTPPGNAGTAAEAPIGVTDTGSVPPAMAMTPPQTEQRARTPVAGTLAGSTRNTERHSGHETVITPLRRSAFPSAHAPVPMRPTEVTLVHPDDDRQPRPSLAVSSHNSSFPWPTR